MWLVSSALVAGIDLSSAFNLATYALFFIFILYGQRIQYYVTLNSISRSLSRLKVLEDGAEKEALDYITQDRADKDEITARVNGVLEYVTIMPESVDPSGVVSKIEHVVRTGDDSCFEVPHRRRPHPDSRERHGHGRDPIPGESALRGQGGGSHGLRRGTRGSLETTSRRDGCQAGRNHNGRRGAET